MALGCVSYAIRYRLNILLFMLLSAKLAVGGTIVKYLPGFEGVLPFTLETGYVTVGKLEMFYYFIESEGNPKEDPIILWYSGGPGCSAWNAIIYEKGPLAFNITAYEGGLPQLYYYPYAWTKTASILFVDAPVGTGFSYATDTADYYTSDTKTGWQVYGFLRNWFEEHPQFLLVQLFVGGDSYSGLTSTIVVKHIIDGNEAGRVPRLNLKGYILGAPTTDEEIITNARITAANRFGLISDELYEAAYNSCNGNFHSANTSQTQCYIDLHLIEKIVKDINRICLLEPKCTWASPKQEPNGESERRSLEEDDEEENFKNFILSPPRIPELWCRNFNYALSYIWANDGDVRQALNIRKNTIYDWKRCNQSLAYTKDVSSVVDIHRYLSTKGLQVLIFNGDHDLIIPSVGTQQWIKSLNLTVVSDWRQWLVDGQVAGYTIKYSENGYRLTYVTVKGTGHTPPEYKRRECYEMYDRFIHYYPL